MQDNDFTARDEHQLRSRGISRETARKQVRILRNGPAYAILERACRPGDGIRTLGTGEREELARAFLLSRDQGRASLFIPASGAATRMFRAPLALLRRPDRPAWETVLREAGQGREGSAEAVAILQSLPEMPFYEDLQAVLRPRGLEAGHLLSSGEYRPLLEALLLSDGLGYAERPKALLPFHAYPEGSRTALEEHLVEARSLVRDRNGVCRIHVTVAPSQREMFQAALAALRKRLEDPSTRFEVEVSTQDPGTDTLALDDGGRPFREEDGSLLLRPGGHGALLRNLQETGGDLVFLKNIDNVVPDAARPEITTWRMALAGLAEGLRRPLGLLLASLREDRGEAHVEEACQFAEGELGIRLPEPLRSAFPSPALRAAKRDYLEAVLDRPLRVCAVVRNQGEPGGGPFWVRHRDGSLRLQIVEDPQVDPRSEVQSRLARSASHFSPTDMVCALRAPDGGAYPLERFRDPEACFVVRKTRDGAPLTALELPGLWNGGMAEWNTVFVEVPAENFNPVKSALDLLRPAHRASMAAAGA